MARLVALPGPLARNIDAAESAAIATAAGFPRTADGACCNAGVWQLAYVGDELAPDSPELAAFYAALAAAADLPPPPPVVSIDANLVPSPGLSYDIGSGSQRFDTIYVSTVNQLSDYRVKADVETLTLGLELIERLRPVTFRYIDGKREHMGFLAQDVRAALLEADPGSDYAVWCSTPVPPGERTGLPAGMDTVESLRPDQLIAPLVRTCQQLADAVADLTDAVKKQGTQLEWAAETIAAIQKAIRERPSL